MWWLWWLWLRIWIWIWMCAKVLVVCSMMCWKIVTFCKEDGNERRWETEDARFLLLKIMYLTVWRICVKKKKKKGIVYAKRWRRDENNSLPINVRIIIAIDWNEIIYHQNHTIISSSISLVSNSNSISLMMTSVMALRCCCWYVCEYSSINITINKRRKEEREKNK